MTVPFQMTRMVEFSDTDLAGIVHFSKFFCYMEAAEHAFLRSKGLSVKMPYEDGEIGFPRVSAGCDYVRPARFEEELIIEVVIRKLGKKSITWGFIVRRDATELATGHITTVCCLIKPGNQLESISIPDSIRDRLA